LVDGPTVGVPPEVVDITEFGGAVASWVRARVHDQLGGVTGVAGEHSSRRAQVDDHVVGFEHDSTNPTVDHGPQCCIRANLHAGRCFATSCGEIARIFDREFVGTRNEVPPTTR
jgi:hypothetical protein